MLNSNPVFSYKILFYFSFIVTVCGCAAMQRPTGGPRDLTPPKLVKAEPENMTRNFSAKQINLYFDEYFKLTNPYQEISISPALEKQADYKSSKKNLQIDFKDSLQKNTTYVINFGKSIADVNESNVLKNFTYVFSTGSHIDSLSISGTVINTATQAKEKDATVFLFPIKQDSLLFGKKKPNIFTTTDSSGNFSLNNLREDTYRIYALKETSADKIYNHDDELIAFSQTPIKVDKDSSGLQLKLFKQVPENFRLLENKFDPDGKISFVFNKRLITPVIKILYPAALDKQKIVDIRPTHDTAFVYMRNMDFDSLSVAFFDGNKPLDTVSRLKGRKETFQRTLTFKYNLNRDIRLKPNTDLKIIGSFPIESFDASQIGLTEDSAAVNNIVVQKDTTDTKLFVLKTRWRPGSKYELTLNEGAFTNIYGDKNKRSLIRFQADKLENYSVLTVKVTVPESNKNYIVELLSEQKVVLQTNVITQNSSLTYKNFLTGKYRFRVVYDENKNGLWDSGNVKRRRYPENIWLSDKEVSLRPNWDAEEILEVPKESINP